MYNQSTCEKAVSILVTDAYHDITRTVNLNIYFVTLQYNVMVMYTVTVNLQFI